MKKLILMFISVLMLFILVSCTRQQPSTPTNQQPAPGVLSTPTTQEIKSCTLITDEDVERVCGGSGVTHGPHQTYSWCVFSGTGMSSVTIIYTSFKDTNPLDTLRKGAQFSGEITPISDIGDEALIYRGRVGVEGNEGLQIAVKKGQTSGNYFSIFTTNPSACGGEEGLKELARTAVGRL